ncbi:MAG: hypothetical protein LUF78_13325 [Clostridiales bacterium]|nr:hypothetical protein [Clostridiales bacterium]
MKEYTAPQAKVVNFENDYVAAAPDGGTGGKPGGSQGTGGGSNFDYCGQNTWYCGWWG